MSSAAAPVSAPKRISNPRASVAMLLLAACIATLPLLLRGPSCGDDFHFHLSSWIEAQRSWKLGILYPHWTSAANFGAGEPRFVFYPPLTWMLGALIGSVLPWAAVPAAMTFVLLAGTAFATRALARQQLQEPAATLAGCIAVFFGYALYTAYARAAFAELSGGFWIPLILLFTLRQRGSAANSRAGLLRRAFDGSALPLSLCIAGAWLSNAPIGVMASYLVAAVALGSAILQRSLAPVLRAGTALTLGIGVSAIYLLPALFEQRWVNISQAVTLPGNRIEENWLFEKLANPLIWWHDKELQRVSWIALFTVALAIVSAVDCWRRGLTPRRWWLPLALIAPTVLLLQLPLSLPIWNLLPKLRYLQFPWRWLLVLEAPMAIFFAQSVFSLAPQRRKIALIASVVLCLAFAAVATKSFFVVCSADAGVPAYLAKDLSSGFAGTPEYAPLGSSATVAPEMPLACLVSDRTIESIASTPSAPQLNHAATCELSLKPSLISQEEHLTIGAEDRVEHLSYVTEIPRAGYLLLRLRRFPAWHFTLNGRPISPVEAMLWSDGLTVLQVPRGPILLAANWTATPDVLASRRISALSLIVLVILGIAEGVARRRITAAPRDAVRLSS